MEGKAGQLKARGDMKAKEESLKVPCDTVYVRRHVFGDSDLEHVLLPRDFDWHKLRPPLQSALVASSFYPFGIHSVWVRVHSDA